MKPPPLYHEIHRAKWMRASAKERARLDAEFKRHREHKGFYDDPDLGTLAGTRRVTRMNFCHPDPPPDMFGDRNWIEVSFEGEFGKFKRQQLGAPSHAIGAVLYKNPRYRPPRGIIWRRALNPFNLLWLAGLWIAYPFRAWARERLISDYRRRHPRPMT